MLELGREQTEMGMAGAPPASLAIEDIPPGLSHMVASG